MESTTGYYHPKRSLISWRALAVVALSVAILSFISPQVSYLGHGLRTTLPALAIFWFAILLASPHALGRAISRFRVTFLLGFIFLLQAALRFAYEDFESYMLWSTHFWQPLIALMFLLAVAALAELGDDTLRSFRGCLLFSWCVSLAIGLPALFENTGVARLTMSDPSSATHANYLAAEGLGDFAQYTALAICFAPLILVVYNLRRVIWRLPGILLVCLSALAVLFSTLTMAAAILVTSFLCILLVWVRSMRGVSRIVYIVFTILLIAEGSFFYNVAVRYPQTGFVVGKAERIYEGISSSGIESGDETGRGERFIEEMSRFAEEPFLGYIPGVTGFRGYGHSSFSNFLVLFGIFAAGLWMVALWFVFRDCKRHVTNSVDRGVLLIAWSALFLSGVLNPTWHSAAILGSLFALTLPPLKRSA